MNPSESEIARKVTELSDEDFQRLAEVYARRTYPERFRELVPVGRNPAGSTTKGRWDAVVRHADGNDVVEATHTRAAKSNQWQKHLEQKLAEAETAGERITGLLYVAWYDDPPEDTIESYKQLAAELGAQPDKIQLIFRKKLTFDLSRPLFADVWVNFLGLPSSCLPFRLASQLHERFGGFHKLGEFAPAKEEYLDGSVHRPLLADTVEARLNSETWAFVRGRGASGKTTLALQLALAQESQSAPADYLDLESGAEPGAAAGVISTRADEGVLFCVDNAHSAPAYYLDLESGAEPGAAAEVISTRADEGVLFCVDNAHLDEQAAREIFDHWSQVARGSRFLMLGRLTSLPPSTKGLARPLVDLETQAMTLQVRTEDLAGVFSRLAKRYLALRGDEVGGLPAPPSDVLGTWLELFGGDLIAFTAAVAERIQQLLNGQWEIREEDASRYVRERYLAPLDEAERSDLLAVSTLATLEVATPKEALDSATFPVSLRSGLVHHTVHGREKHERFHLVHAGMGGLLRKASTDPPSESQVFIDIARRSPFPGMWIATRLEAEGRQKQCLAVLEAVVESEERLKTALLAPGLQYARASIALLGRSGVLSQDEMDHRLAQSPAELCLAALRTPLGYLPSFLEYAERKLPKVYGAVASALAEPANLPELTRTALRTPLGYLPSFLEYAERKLPKVYGAVASALAEPANLQELTRTTPRTPLGYLASFLEYAERKLPKVYAAVASALAEPANLDTVARVALHSQLDQLAPFLEAVHSGSPEASQALQAELEKSDAVQALACAACEAPLSSLLNFLRSAATARLSEKVVNAINRDLWEKQRLRMKSEQPSFFPDLCIELTKLGRPELAEAPACALIHASDVGHWHSPNIGLHHLSHLLRMGRGAGELAVGRFVDRVVTEDWLLDQYASASAHGIAAALFVLWEYFDEPIWERFRTKALGARLFGETGSLKYARPQDLSGALQLLGCSALVGVNASGIRGCWPNDMQVAKALESSAPAPDLKSLGVEQARLWLGLREMTRLHPDGVLVPAGTGNQILELWKQAQPSTSSLRLEKLNAWMIEWLERCCAADWRLVRDESRPT